MILAAEQGNSIAYYGLGECYEYDHGVNQDIIEATKLYKFSGKCICYNIIDSLNVKKQLKNDSPINASCTYCKNQR
jgi:hypothetical protein